MNRLIMASCLLALVGCQQSSQVNPFSVYGPQRLPPPPTGAYGQPATTTPYYNAPTIQGGVPAGTVPGYGQPPAQFAPPSGVNPAPAGTYQNGQWRGVSQTGSPSGVVPASFTEEVSTTPAASTGSSASGLDLQGMRVNQVPAEGVSASSSPVNPVQATVGPGDTGWISQAGILPPLQTPQPTGFSSNSAPGASRIP